MLIYLMEGGDDDDDDEDVRWLSYACHMVIIIRIICRQSVDPCQELLSSFETNK